MSDRTYKHLSAEPVLGGVRLLGSTTIAEDVTITAQPSEDGRSVRLEGGYASMPPAAARAVAAALIAAADAVEGG